MKCKTGLSLPCQFRIVTWYSVVVEETARNIQPKLNVQGRG
ncbi:MAG: hypothetical protein R3339_10355 [Thermodesulfobacteriota bacterium]|nr:hypothetical protein [Thermodesulfobacteriota bacterium]